MYSFDFPISKKILSCRKGTTKMLRVLENLPYEDFDLERQKGEYLDG